MQEDTWRRILDLIDRSEERGVVAGGAFLSAEEAAELEHRLKKLRANYVFSGGVPGAERAAFFALPAYLSPEEFRPEEYLSAVRIRPADGVSYGHRDYLGSVMALGVARDKLGDIVVCGGEAYLVGYPLAVRYVAEQLTSVSRTSAGCEPVSLTEIPEKRAETERFTVSLSSLRADCVAGGLFGLSRTEAASCIESGLFSVNKRTEQKCDRQLKIGDVVSLRGRGRVKLESEAGTSRKGKLRVECVRELR